MTPRLKYSKSNIATTCSRRWIAPLLHLLLLTSIWNLIISTFLLQNIIVYKKWMFMDGMIKIFSWDDRWKVPLHEATGEWNGKFHLSPNENIFIISRAIMHSLIYNKKIHQCYWFFIELNTKQIRHIPELHAQYLNLIEIQQICPKNVWVKS